MARKAGAPIPDTEVEQCDPARRSVEPVPDVRHVVSEMERAPDAVILPFLARLRTRRQELAHALQGRSLRAQVVLDTQRRSVYRLVFTPTGNVELTGAHGFDPH